MSRKGDSGLALGNAIGSNIFNILFILGMSATVSPLNVLGKSVDDAIILTKNSENSPHSISGEMNRFFVLFL